jgi:hypothetical protein
MHTRFVGLTLLVLIAIVFPSASAHAGASDSRFEVGVRYVLVTAGGEPANDMMAGGVFARFRLNERWRVGAALDSMSGDYERPYELVGLTSPEEIDGTIDSLLVSGWIERVYGKPQRKLRWFWTAGLGFTSPDVDDVTGPTSGGGTFEIATDPGSETIVSVTGGLRRLFGRRWGFEAAARFDHHFADWDVVDRVSGMTGSVDDYTSIGLHLGILFRF